MPQKAVFLDKDGTLIQDVPYNVNPALVAWEPGVIQGLRALQSQGYLLVIISNQPGIAMGLFTEEAITALIRYFNQTLDKEGISISGFYYCPHGAPEMGHAATCACRKPQPGLILKAASELDVDVSGSWMIGDILNDVEAGSRAGCRTVLINNGNETEWLITSERIPDHLADDFSDAVQFILDQTGTLV